MKLTLGSKAILVLAGCSILFVANMGVLLWLQSKYRGEVQSSAFYSDYLTYRTLLLRPFGLIPFAIFVIFCLWKIYKNQAKKPINERQQLYLLAIVCAMVLGLILTATFKL
jgi:cbb3-type cytochrome oxidase subunit 3